MSIQSEITRLQNAKASIKTAIENKGITVPDDALLDEIPALIESIESGGSATEPYVEETYDSNGNLINANLVGYTKIRDYAFHNCQNLALTSLPSGIANIGNYAFYNCQNLALTSLPSGIANIGNYAFYNCQTLALTSLPSEITSIGNEAFHNCQNLALISLPSGITSIGNYAFHNCQNLALTSLPSGITSIGNDAFHNCQKLALTSLPSGITSIGDRAFYNCQNLALISLPSGITSIGKYAFEGCTKLTSITFEGTPNSIISNTAFSGCTDLTTINVPWAKNEVANAPWGATNATINYNYGVSEEGILSPTTFTFGDNSFAFGDYLMSENSASASLVEGKTYMVTMDGNDYNCTAYVNSNINGFICLDIDSTFSYANGYMFTNDKSYVGSKTISIKLIS